MENTNVIRILNNKKINFIIHDYSNTSFVKAKDAANYLNIEENKLFKTLVTKSKFNFYVFVVPSSNELDLKKAAKAVNEKKIEMIPQKDLYPLTGYVHGGCSPIGMKKQYKTFIDKSAEELSTICISGGRIGYTIEISPNELKKVINFDFCDLI